MANFVHDTFQDTNGQNVSGAHTGETGASWTVAIGSADDFEIFSNRARAAHAVGGSAYTPSGNPANADYTVTAKCDYINTASTWYTGLLGRFVDASNYFRIGFYPPDSTWYLEKKVSGATSTIGTPYADSGYVAGQSRVVILSMVGTTIKVKIDGTDRITVTEAALSAAGKPGIWVSAAAVGDGMHLDTFDADDASAPSVTVPIYFRAGRHWGYFNG